MTKRSNRVAIAILGAAAFSLAGCREEEVDAQAFPDLESCTAQAEKGGMFSAQDCEAAFAARAGARHAMTVSSGTAGLHLCLFASGIGRIGALYELEDDKPGARILWKGKPKTAVYCSNSTPVIVGDTIYGVDIDTSQLMAVSMEDGRRLWGTTGPVMEATTGNDRHGTAFLTRHVESGLFYLFNEAGELVIARLTPDAFTELSRTRLLEPTNEAFGRAVVWSPPAFADRSILVRNDKQLVRVKLAAE